jgi:hypothetical protein
MEFDKWHILFKLVTKRLVEIRNEPGEKEEDNKNSER